MTNWEDCIAQIAPQLVRIQSADRSGTGFILYGSDGGARFIATARHVIESFLGNQENFFVCHGNGVFGYGMPGSNDVLNFSLTERPNHDATVFAVINKKLPKPAVHLVDPSKRAGVTAGAEVGWLGFPSLEHLDPDLSFFSGRVSRLDAPNGRYLIDGTSVPGCSGGPVFLPTPNGPRIIGALTDRLLSLRCWRPGWNGTPSWPVGSRRRFGIPSLGGRSRQTAPRKTRTVHQPRQVSQVQGTCRRGRQRGASAIGLQVRLWQPHPPPPPEFR